MKKPHIAALTFALGLSPFAPMGVLAAAADAGAAGAGPASSYDDRVAIEQGVQGSAYDGRTATFHGTPSAASGEAAYEVTTAAAPVAVEREAYVQAPRETIVVSPPFAQSQPTHVI